MYINYTVTSRTEPITFTNFSYKFYLISTDKYILASDGQLGLVKTTKIVSQNKGKIIKIVCEMVEIDREKIPKWLNYRFRFIQGFSTGAPSLITTRILHIINDKACPVLGPLPVLL